MSLEVSVSFSPGNGCLNIDQWWFGRRKIGRQDTAGDCASGDGRDIKGGSEVGYARIIDLCQSIECVNGHGSCLYPANP
ncbi:hypothetical protein H4S06_006810, partial [Coemansia sp. BCRC 34490]